MSKPQLRQQFIHTQIMVGGHFTKDSAMGAGLQSIVRRNGYVVLRT